MATPTPTPTPTLSVACANSECWSQVRLFREARLDDDTACVRWCLEAGILAQPKECWKCRKDPVLRFREDRMSHFWHCTKCRRQWSVTVGSVFEDSKLPLPKALMLVLCYAQGARLESARLAAMLTGGDSKPRLATVCEWFDTLRAKVNSMMEEETSTPIGGPGMIVQVDECLLGRRKYHRGRKMPGTWVLGMIAEDGETRFEVIADKSANTLCGVVKRNVRPGSFIHTDEWKSYKRLSRLGYRHASVNHSVEFVSADGIHTQRIESQWRAVRRKFTRGGIRHDDIPIYLHEYIWRRRCRWRDESPFESLLELLRVPE